MKADRTPKAPTKAPEAAPVSPLKLKVPITIGLTDQRIDLVKRANAAIQTLAPQFDGWLESALRRIDNAYENYQTDFLSVDMRASVTRHAMDIKCLAAMIGYPLVSRVSGSLLRLMDATAPAPPPQVLAERHLALMQSILQAKARALKYERLLEMTIELESEVNKLLPIYRKALSSGSAISP
jgi:hypothetical protein